MAAFTKIESRAVEMMNQAGDARLNRRAYSAETVAMIMAADDPAAATLAFYASARERYAELKKIDDATFAARFPSLLEAGLTRQDAMKGYSADWNSVSSAMLKAFKNAGWSVKFPNYRSDDRSVFHLRPLAEVNAEKAQEDAEKARKAAVARSEHSAAVDDAEDAAVAALSEDDLVLTMLETLSLWRDDPAAQLAAARRLVKELTPKRTRKAKPKAKAETETKVETETEAATA
jgi:hypothetical protein